MGLNSYEFGMLGCTLFKGTNLHLNIFGFDRTVDSYHKSHNKCQDFVYLSHLSEKQSKLEALFQDILC